MILIVSLGHNVLYDTLIISLLLKKKFHINYFIEKYLFLGFYFSPISQTILYQNK